MSQSSESDLEGMVAEALAASREVPPQWREAARAAYTWRSVDQELLALSHDSLLDAGAAVRGAGEERTLEFTGAGLTLAVEVTSSGITGQLTPPVAAEVVLERADGDGRSTEADESGFFSLEAVGEGLVRLAVRSGEQRLVTEWLSL